MTAMLNGLHAEKENFAIKLRAGFTVNTVNTEQWIQIINRNYQNCDAMGYIPTEWIQRAFKTEYKFVNQKKIFMFSGIGVWKSSWKWKKLQKKKMFIKMQVQERILLGRKETENLIRVPSVFIYLCQWEENSHFISMQIYKK